MQADLPGGVRVSDEPAGTVYLLPARDRRPFRRFGGFFALFALVVFGVGALMVRIGDAAGAEFVGWFLAVPCLLLGVGVLALAIFTLTGTARSRTRILLNARDDCRG